MDFAERLRELALKVAEQRDLILTEEATKNAFVMPFIANVLGYDIFDPTEVMPEFTMDVGVKKGEKIDYVIKHNGVVQILIECKKVCGPLRVENASQLFRYFAICDARIAILTNGEVYQFYTDLDVPNRMDKRPFLTLDLNNIDETLIPEVMKLTRDAFDLDSIINAAEELKYVGEIKRQLAAEFKEPDDEWLRLFISRAYEGSITQRVREQFAPLVKKAAVQFLNEQVNDRLKVALGGSNLADPPAVSVESEPEAEAGADEADDEIVTTFEELEGFQIVRAIACGCIAASRITYRDARSYFAIMLDDNNRKTIVRLHFNRKQKYLGTFDADKKETRHPIDSPEGIYRYAEEIRATVNRHAGTSPAPAEAP